MKFVTLKHRDDYRKTAKAFHFKGKRREVLVGFWSSFPIRKPINFRLSENLTTRGWQVDVLYFSLAVKYLEAN